MIGLRDKMDDKRIRICDIAEELGLSSATVSNVIHGKTHKVSDETVRRVQELLEKREYIPSMAGILVAQNNSGIIGIVVNQHEKYEMRVLEDPFIDLMHFLQAQGICVPQDISIVGFDDVPICDQVYPALTSVRQDGTLRAKTAIEKLLELKSGKEPGATVTLPVHLIVRESTCPLNPQCSRN